MIHLVVKINARGLKAIAKALAVSTAAASLLVFSDGSRQGVKNGVEMCLNVPLIIYFLATALATRKEPKRSIFISLLN